MNSSAVRDLFDIASGEIEMSDGYGKSSFAPWTTTPTFQNFTGGLSTINGTYTPTSGTVKFLVMMWSSVGHGGNSTAYTNLPAIGASGAHGAGYSERLYTHSGSTTYSYKLGSQANYQAVGGGYTPPSRSYAGTTYFYGPGATMSCTGTGNPGGSGTASGGTFNASGGAGGSSTGGGGGSRTGNGTSSGGNGGTSLAAGATNINFWVGAVLTGQAVGGKVVIEVLVVGENTTHVLETLMMAVLLPLWKQIGLTLMITPKNGAPKSNQSNGTRGAAAQILILEYHSGDSDGT